MTLLPADYALLGLALVMSVTGLFRGLSGMLAFVVSTVVVCGVGALGWTFSETVTVVLWQRVGLTALIVLVAFGIVRLVVTKIVHAMLAQPADAIFGFLAGIALVALIAVGLAAGGIGLEYSNVIREVANYVG